MHRPTRVLASLAFTLSAACAALCASTNASAATSDCGADVLGTARTLVLKREYGAWGTAQHQALPLQKGEVVLTFDDGPRPESTPLVLKALAEQCVKATFFMVGASLEQSPDLAQRVVREGHSTGLHSYAHANLGQLSPAQQLDDLKRAEESYRTVFGGGPPAYRFPFLAETPDMTAALKSKNIAVFSVDFGIDDWQDDDTTAALAARLSDRLQANGGGMILLHDAHQATANAMPTLLKVLKSKGLRIVHLAWEP
jgi:peptidoglycan/xylan/chitin deacetylase (PgdA/CDA1 family)